MSSEKRVSPYDYEFDPKGDSTAARLVRMVGVGKRVLELGCGYGVISQELTRHQACRVTGVELDGESAAFAQDRLEHLVVANLEDPGWLSSLRGTFDVVLAADVVEHLRDPAQLLREVRGLIADDGHLVVSFPNIGHAGIIAQLLSGAFEYRETGILDFTHLRFFTWSSFEALLNDAGFEVTARECVEAPGGHEHFHQYWAALPGPVRSVLHTHPTTSVFQYVLTARKTDKPAKLPTADVGLLARWAEGIG